METTYGRGSKAFDDSDGDTALMINLLVLRGEQLLAAAVQAQQAGNEGIAVRLSAEALAAYREAVECVERAMSQ